MLESLNPIILIPITVGPIFIVAGLIMLIFPPKKINRIYGYRTPGSMKSQERWDFAQKYSAREMIRIGGLLLLTSSLGIFYQPEDSIGSIVGIGTSLFFTIILFVRVEKAIDNRFSDASE